MPGRYIIVLLILPCIGFSDGNISTLPFPWCNRPLTKTVRVNRGENASLHIRLLIQVYDHHWNAHFTWARAGGETLCSLSRGKSWGGGIDSQFYMAVTGDRDQTSSRQGYVNYIDFELTISKSSYSDQGIYFLHSSVKTPCKILKCDYLRTGCNTSLYFILAR